jgi:hypothetical protein
MDDAPLPPEYLPSVEKFLAGSAGYQSGNSCPAGFESDWMFPLQREKELQRMVRLAWPFAPRTLVEIGADKGSGIFQWCKCLPSLEKVVAIEPRGCPYGPAMAKAFPGIQFLFIGQGSLDRGVGESVYNFVGGKGLDVLFIDGDKTGMARDFHHYRNLYHTGTLIFFHDICDESPRAGFEEVIRDFRLPHMRIIDTEDAELACMREMKGIAPAHAHEGWLRHWKGQSCGVGVVFM